jgi:CheY-like chemotaxis protein
MLIKCLAVENHVCDSAADGNQAIEKVEKRMGWSGRLAGSRGLGRPYDIILMDFVVKK